MYEAEKEENSVAKGCYILYQNMQTNVADLICSS